MKIALFHNLPAGGAKRTVYEEAKFLAKNHSLDLFELSSTKEDFKDIRPFCRQVFKFNYTHRKNYFMSLLQLIKVHKQIAGKINAGGYDVALIHLDQYSEAPFVLRFLKIPSLYYCQEYLRIGYEKELISVNTIYERITRRFRKYFDRTNAQSASIILTNSNFTKNNIDRAYKINSVVSYLGVDHKIFKPVTTPKLNQVLFIGSPTKLKGYDLAIKALALITKKIRPDLVLLNAYSHDLVNNDRKLAKIYSQSLATLCLGFREPFGLSALESQACGTPVIAVRDGGYKETVPKEFVVSKNPHDIASKIVAILKKPPKVSTNFPWADHCRIVENSLLKLSRLKILISGQDSGGLGGSEKFMLDLANELKLNNEVEFTTVAGAQFTTEIKASGFSPLTVPVRMDILGWWRGLIKFIYYLPDSLIMNYQILKKYKNSNPAKIIISGYTDKLILSPIAKALGYRVIWVEYAPLKSVFSRNLGIPKLLYRLVLPCADKIICPTQNTYQNLLAEKIFDIKKLTIIPIGIKILK
jgi:glycosyltransferase involved in cell wall biosynthesis